MSQVLVSPFYISYDGNDAAHNIINAQKLGESLIGASKLYSAVAHYCMFGDVPKRNYQKRVLCYAKPPAEGSFEYIVFLGSIGAEGGLFNGMVKEALSVMLPIIVGGIKKIWSKPTEVEKVVDRLAAVIEKQSDTHSSLHTMLINGLIRAQEDQAKSQVKLLEVHEKLIMTMGDLAANTRNHGRAMVAPVGNTCTSVKQFAHTDQEITIDEAEAQVIRGDNDMEIDEMQEFKCRQITEVNVRNGHCFLDIEGFNGVIPGKINDPALALPNNIYTKSLNEQRPFTISAKPVTRNGVIQKLYVSDAKETA